MSASVEHPAQVVDAVRGRRAVLMTAAVLLAVAAIVHALVVREHLHEYLPAGVFFVALTAVQALEAWWLWRRPVGLALHATIWVQGATVALWAVSRTVPLPLGGGRDHDGGVEHAVGGVGDGAPRLPASGIEPVGTLDVLSVLAELAVIAMVVQALPADARRRTSTALSLIALLGLVAWTVRSLR